MTRRPDLLARPEVSAEFMRGVQLAAPQPRLHSLGGSGLLVRFLQASVVIDPYLLNTLGDRDPEAPAGWRDRDAPPPVRPQDLTGLNAILITHGHGDHFDVPSLQALTRVNPDVTVVLPRTLRKEALRAGLPEERLQHLAEGERVQLADMVVQAVPAAHTPPELPQPQPDGLGGFAEVGYLLHLGPVTLYHAGDTVVHPHLPGLLRGVDVAVLPINGRRWSPFQPARLGNLTAEEAADLAGLCGIGTVVPVHHTLLGSSAGGLGAFLEYSARRWPDLQVASLRPGEAWTVHQEQSLPERGR
ncbi:MBL fold metallo-hydrolase [Deinococcus altitudinis]|uniref:MBL fold metallo-hydrolase n=1 Tax=Deinococcus altitudinis TaxID=468914 RepID=UPI00389195FB